MALGLGGPEPTDSQVGGPEPAWGQTYPGLNHNLEETQKSRVLLLGPGFGGQRRVRLGSRGLHCREGKQIWSPPLGSSIWRKQKLVSPAPLTWGSGSPPLPEADPPNQKSPSHCSSLEALSGRPQGSPSGMRPERQVWRGTPLSDAGREAGGAVPTAAGKGRPGDELEEDKGGKWVLGDGPGVVADHKSW